ncbi:flagellar basal body-associated protein FliL [Pradoshia eiseniae]|uniref:Flagellar protein FliL n=1 Tax=Pradoshia eiseniae TaxID=2064768 RepID=A0A2S7N1I6_9BACI|nr:flagellar basal body-associated protein FliL [Pradoshia eiseniae]PQD95860.1 flagellar basal body-associated protein FliL [Pradoshia eiseniae]
MKNRTSIAIILMFAAVLILMGAGGAIYSMKYMDDRAQTQPSIDEVIKLSVEVPEITTNLKDDTLIQISFMIETDDREAREELEKREFQIKDIVINELSEIEARQLKGKKAKQEMEDKLTEQINGLMQEGEVVEIYTTSSILQ